MLAPPPDQRNSTSEDIEGEERKKYLKTLESKLGRLQGTDKRKLKSKDILNALTEARDDHLSNSNFEPQPQESPGPNLSHTASNDPWSSMDSEQDATAIRKDGFGRMEFDLFEEGDSNSSQRSCWPCSRCRRSSVDRSKTKSERNKLTPEEESAYLLHCDHLSRL